MSADAGRQSPAPTLAVHWRCVRDHIEFSPIFISDLVASIAYTIGTAYLWVATGGEEPGCLVFVFLVALIGAGQYLKIHQMLELKRRGGDARAYEPSDALVIEGPYKFSRNPTYLVTSIQNVFWSILLIHEGDVVAQAPMLAVAALVIPVMHFVAIDKWVIPREEADLRLSHPAEYAAYCARVNRWIGVRRG